MSIFSWGWFVWYLSLKVNVKLLIDNWKAKIYIQHGEREGYSPGIAKIENRLLRIFLQPWIFIVKTDANAEAPIL